MSAGRGARGGALALLLVGCASVDPMRTELLSRDAQVRAWAVADTSDDDELTSLGKLRQLVPAMEDPDEMVRGAARRAVSRLVGRRTPWEVCEMLRPETIHAEAVWLALALHELGHPMDCAVEPLRAAVREEPAGLQVPYGLHDERLALCVLGAPAHGTVERIVAGLEQATFVDREVAYALAALGPRAAAAVPALRRARARDPLNGFVVDAALARIEPREYVRTMYVHSDAR